MASTPTPPQCSAISVAKPSQNHHRHRHRHHQSHHLKDQRQTRAHWVSNRFPLSNPPPAAASSSTAAAAVASDGGAPGLPFPSSRSLLGADFSGRRSTRFVSKVHAGRPGSRNIPHSSVADEALKQLLQCGKDDTAVLDSVLLNFEHSLSGSSDYAFLIRELGNCKECGKATRCYDFALRRESRKYELGRLTSAMISVLGRLGKVDDARSVFETAKKEGYGDTVYTHSALISAYGRNSFYNEAISVFESMKNTGIKPNLVTYNAVIDAGAKGGVRFDKVVEIFDEMLANGVQPDSITYNSLLAVCSHVGSWEMALNLFREMGKRGLAQDVCTYNTLLDAVCKGGQIDLASEIMAEMSAKKLSPTVVTYSTVIDGYAKAGRLQEALSLFSEMKSLSIELDRVSYNTKVSIYASLGRFVEAMETCREMESCGFEKEVVTYNALLDGYGKHGRYDDVKKTFEQMKTENVKPNVLTYSTMIDVYSKGGLYREAMNVYREFKKTGLKADVVLYSALIDALCKNGLVESAVMLLDEMTTEGIRPNVVTYNSIIDAFGRSPTLECGVHTPSRANEHQIGPSSSMLIAGPCQDQVKDNELKQIIIKMFGQLAAEKAGHWKKDMRGRHDTFSIMVLFRKMHELGIKPNVVTFSAILNACSRCNSFEEARMLLEELRLFDNVVYGVTYGLLMGYRENIWFQAQSLFDEVKRMDSFTASAFYNALTDMLWHFGQKQGAQLVVLEGKCRNVWDGVFSDSCLDLHLMSCGAACAMVHSWLLDIRSIVFEGHELPKLLSILTGWGKHSKVVGDGTLRKAIEALLNGMGAPFRVAECNLGRFISPGYVLAAWLKELSTFKLLVLHDHINYLVTAKSGQVYNLQPLRL